MSKEADTAQRIHQLENDLEAKKKELAETRTALDKELKQARELIVHLHQATETQQEKLEELGETNAELREFADRVMAPPQKYGNIVRVYLKEEAVDISVAGSVEYRNLRPGIDVRSLAVGDRMRVDAGTGAVTGRAPHDDQLGDERKLVNVLENDTALIEDKMGHRRVARLSRNLLASSLEGGERVIVADDFITAVLRASDKEALAALRNVIAQLPDMTFDDIAGLETIIDGILKDILLPYDYPEGNEHYKIEPGFKYLFYGPPGNGKTSLIKAIARLIYDRFRDQIVAAGVKGNLIAIHGPELSSKWIGETEERMRNIFDGAAQLHQLIKCPVILSIDDCESFLLQRGMSNASTANMDYVTQMTTLLEGVKDYPGVCLILTTNRIDLMDSTIVARMKDLVQYVPPPDTPEIVEAIIRKHLREVAVDGDPVPPLVARLFDDGPEMDAIEAHFEDAESERFPLREFISGRMLRDIVGRAKKTARNRDRELPAEKRPSGINGDDLLEALEVHLENSGSLPSTKATVMEWLRQKGDKRNLLFVNALRDKKKQEARKKQEERIDRTVV